MFKKIKKNHNKFFNFRYFEYKDFRSDIQDFESITNEKAEFVYQASKEFLNHTADSLKNFYTKIYLILGFIFFTIIFSISEAADCSNFFNQKCANFFLGIAISYSIIAIILIFLTSCQDSAISGDEPKNLISQDTLNYEIAIIKIAETETYQRRIDINLFLNQKNALIIKYSLLAMLLSVLFLIFTFFIFN